MKKVLFLIIVFALLTFSACDTESEVSKNEPQQESNVSESKISESSEVSEDPLATKEWENETRKDGKIILYKYTKVFDGDTDNYTITALEYTDDVLTGKVITVVTDGVKTHEEEYKYDGETVIRSSKNDYTAESGDMPVYSVGTEIFDYDDYASREYEHYYSADGTFEKGTNKYYKADGSLYRTEELSAKTMDGYDCTYTVTTTYENGAVVNIMHTASDRDLKYSYYEYRTADDVILYTTKRLEDINILFFPAVGSMTAKKTEYEFFDADGNTISKGRLENSTINLYENTSGLSTEEALKIVEDIINKVNEFGLTRYL